MRTKRWLLVCSQCEKEMMPGSSNGKCRTCNKKPVEVKKKQVVETADMRFQGTLPLQKYRKLTIGIAGLGAVGRQVAILLAAMGHKKLYGADPDKVELKNVGTQGWDAYEIGRYKSDVITVNLNTRHSSFTGYPYKFEEKGAIENYRGKTDVFFCCVDTMQARHAIWDVVTSPTYKTQQISMHKGKKIPRTLQGLWIDSRMTTRIARVITVPLGNKKARAYYEKSLYTDEEAFQGVCTDRMTMYGACISAGLMVSQLANWLNEMPLIRDFLLETQTMTSTWLADFNGNKKV